MIIAAFGSTASHNPKPLNPINPKPPTPLLLVGFLRSAHFAFALALRAHQGASAADLLEH